MRSPLAVAALLLAACATGNGDRVKTVEPDVQIETVEVPRARPGRANQFTTVVRVNVMNRSSSSISIDRVELSTAGTGAFNIAAGGRDFHKILAPNQAQTFGVWAQVTVATDSDVIVQNEGPIFVRGLLTYSSGGNASRKVFMQRVATTMTNP